MLLYKTFFFNHCKLHIVTIICIIHFPKLKPGVMMQVLSIYWLFCVRVLRIVLRAPWALHCMTKCPQPGFVSL